MKNTHTHMGTRLRELRLARGLQQGEVARRLGVSPAYLSLIEKDKRAVQLPLLFKALELYGIGMEEFMQSLGERRVDDGLARLLDEPLLRSLNLSEEDLAQLGSEPRMATTVTALFNMYKNTRSQLDHSTRGARGGGGSGGGGGGGRAAAVPATAVRARATSAARMTPLERISLGSGARNRPATTRRRWPWWSTARPARGRRRAAGARPRSRPENGRRPCGRRAAGG